MGVERLHHVGLAVRSLDEALKFFSGLFGLEVESTIVVEEQGMRAAWLKLGDVKVELMEPIGEEGPVAKFLAKRGEGIHHIAVNVSDINAISEALREAGIKLVYDKPRVAHDGSLYNFIHPKSAHGVLIELRQEGAAERGFTFLEHTADQYVLAYGPDLRSAFEEAGRALFATMTDLSTVEPKVEVEVEVEGGDVKALLYNWLEALLLKLDIDGLLLSKFKVLEISGPKEGPLKLKGLAWGEPFNPAKHPQYVGVKGITYHLMEVKELPSRVELRFLLDI